MFSSKLRSIGSRHISSVIKYLRQPPVGPQPQQTLSLLRKPLSRVTCFASLYCCYHYLNSNLYLRHLYDTNSWIRFAECLRDNNKKNRSNTPKEQQLFEAIKSGDISSVKKLIEEKTIDVNCRHEYGWTPLLLAAVNSRTDICELLLNCGADINITDEYSSAQKMSYELGYNYLQMSLIRELEFSDLLSTRVSFRGTTPLHYAVLANSDETVELLMKRGANPNLENEMGHKPIDYVFESNRKLRQKLVEYENKFAEIQSQRELEERLKFPLEQRIKQVIVGQTAAITTVAAAIRRKENGWYDDNHPLVFLFLGSSGIIFNNKYLF